MNAATPAPASLACRPVGAADEVRRAVVAFEEAWELGRPSLEGHWARCGADAPVAVLAALVKADMGRRFERGEPAAVADYLSRFPELTAERDRMVSLIYEEFCLLAEAGERPEPGSFCERYSEWKDSIQSQLRYHSLISRVVAPTAPPRFPESGERFGGFRLGPVLGQGGAARVFRANEEELGDREVVLKVSPDRGEEPAIQGRLDHAHIVRVLSVVRPPDREDLRGLVMPYRPGRPLNEAIERIAPELRPRRAGALLAAVLPTALAGRGGAPESPGWLGFPTRGTYADGVAWVVATLARALRHAHEQGIYHRDVKPANILLTIEDGPQLLDFNLARSPHAAEGASAAVRGGTLPYMAPEQLEAFLDPSRWGDVGPAADLYALGLVLRELLTGERPDAPDPKLPTTRAIRDMLDRRALPLPPAREKNPGVPHALDAILARCLAFRPSDRYAAAAELVEDLERYLGRRPLLLAENLSRREVAANWAHRNRLALAMAAALVAAVPASSAARRVADAMDPISAERYVELGHDHFQHRRYDDAREMYGRAIRLKRGLYTPYWGLAEVAGANRDYPTSEGYFDQALEKLRDSPTVVPDEKVSDILVGRARMLLQWGLAIQNRDPGAAANIEAGPYYDRAGADLERARRTWQGGAVRRYLVEFLTAKARVGQGDAASAGNGYRVSVARYRDAVRHLDEAIRLNRGSREAPELLEVAKGRRDTDTAELRRLDEAVAGRDPARDATSPPGE